MIWSSMSSTRRGSWRRRSRYLRRQGPLNRALVVCMPIHRIPSHKGCKGWIWLHLHRNSDRINISKSKRQVDTFKVQLAHQATGKTIQIPQSSRTYNYLSMEHGPMAEMWALPLAKVGHRQEQVIYRISKACKVRFHAVLYSARHKEDCHLMAWRH